MSSSSEGAQTPGRAVKGNAAEERQLSNASLVLY